MPPARLLSVLRAERSERMRTKRAGVHFRLSSHLDSEHEIIDNQFLADGNRSIGLGYKTVVQYLVFRRKNKLSMCGFQGLVRNRLGKTQNGKSISHCREKREKGACHEIFIYSLA